MMKYVYKKFNKDIPRSLNEIFNIYFLLNKKKHNVFR